ncbi:MAG: phosphoribosylanthranilate isomerase [bacterium]
MKIKICGVTNEEDVRLISDAGADYLGLLLDVPSPRSLTLERVEGLSKISRVPVVILFSDAETEKIQKAVERIRPYAIQLQGNESPEVISNLRKYVTTEIWKALHFPAQGDGIVPIEEVKHKMKEYAEAGSDKIILDTVVVREGKREQGGTGKTHDWGLAEELAALSAVPVFLAGGLNPENVCEAIEKVQPYGVDLSSGVEKSVGKKDPQKVRTFIKRVREWIE